MTVEIQMRRALDLARNAAAAGEVPVGAVLVSADGEVLGEGWNQPLSSHDPTAHAEIVAMRAAAARMRNYRLPGTTLYVTLEPCLMCAGAMLHARIARLVFAAADPKVGAVSGRYRVFDLDGINHRIECTGGVLAEESGVLLREFFAARR